MLKEVAIPMSSRKAAAAPQPPSSKRGLRRYQGSSTGTPSLDNSDYETPDTSISTTPAISFKGVGKSTRKSLLSEAMSANLGASSSRKRSRIAVEASKDDISAAIDLDAELAMQITMEEEAQERKRQKIAFNDSSVFDLDDDEPLVPRRRAPASSYKGKGKGKAPARDAVILDSDDDMSASASIVAPAYAGKGKGKAKADSGPIRGPIRPVRGGARGRTTIISDDDLSEYLSDEDEFKLEDDELDILLDEDDDDISVMMSDIEPGTWTFVQTSRPLKPGKGKKYKAPTNAEKAARQDRLARFAHIEDKWERKRAMNRERAEQAHPKLLTMWDDLGKVPVLEVQQAEQPNSITRRLKPFQLEGLSWMTRQEKTQYKGGLLGDEMGMGKTIQAVSLIMSDFPAKDPTLVVVPPVALMQWSNEIREYTDGKLKVLVYHGTYGR